MIIQPTTFDILMLSLKNIYPSISEKNISAFKNILTVISGKYSRLMKYKRFEILAMVIKNTIAIFSSSIVGNVRVLEDTN
jgi:hypothetical protein